MFKLFEQVNRLFLRQHKYSIGDNSNNQNNELGNVKKHNTTHQDQPGPTHPPGPTHQAVPVRTNPAAPAWRDRI